MKERIFTCPDCGGDMTDGFLLDDTQNGRHPLFWVQGAAERSFLLGTKLRGRPIYFTDTYRCESCGLLKSYAHRRRR